MILDCCVVPKEKYVQEFLTKRKLYPKPVDIPIGLEPSGSGTARWRMRQGHGQVNLDQSPSVGTAQVKLNSQKVESTVAPATPVHSPPPHDDDSIVSNYDKMNDTADDSVNNQILTPSQGKIKVKRSGISMFGFCKICISSPTEGKQDVVSVVEEKQEVSQSVSPGSKKLGKRATKRQLDWQNSYGNSFIINEDLGSTISSPSSTSSSSSSASTLRTRWSTSAEMSKALEAGLPPPDGSLVNSSLLESSIPDDALGNMAISVSVQGPCDDPSALGSDIGEAGVVVSEAIPLSETDDVTGSYTLPAQAVEVTPTAARTTMNTPQGLKRVAGNKNAISSSPTGLITKDPSKMVGTLSPTDTKLFFNVAEFVRKSIWTDTALKKDGLVAIWLQLYAASMIINGENNPVASVVSHLASRSKGEIVTNKAKEAAPKVEFMARRVFRSFLDEVIDKDNHDPATVHKHVISETKFAIGEKPQNLSQRLDWIKPLLKGELYPNSKPFNLSLAKKLVQSKPNLIKELGEYFLDYKNTLDDIDGKIVGQIFD